jgi:hypothetical protein
MSCHGSPVYVALAFLKSTAQCENAYIEDFFTRDRN